MKFAPKTIHFILDLSDHPNKEFIKTGKEMCNSRISFDKYLGVVRLTDVSELHWLIQEQTSFAEIVQLGTQELIGSGRAWRRKVLHTRPGCSHPAQL